MTFGGLRHDLLAMAYGGCPYLLSIISTASDLPLYQAAPFLDLRNPKIMLHVLNASVSPLSDKVLTLLL